MLFLGSAVSGVGLAAFISQVALTESANLQTGVLAAFFRVVTISLTVTFVVTSVVRETNDKGLHLILSLPISRSTYFLGKLAGYSACGVSLSALYSILLLIWAPPLPVLAWGASLAIEVSLMAAVGLFFVLALSQVVPALAAVGGVYLLGRIIGVLQAITASPLTSTENVFPDVAKFGINFVAVLLPPFDKATQTAWLLYGAPSTGDFASIVGALSVYGGLIISAGLFDFHRRNL